MSNQVAPAARVLPAATAEWVNAQFRNQGLIRLLVRGTKKVLAVVLVHALANNMRRSWALG